MGVLKAVAQNLNKETPDKLAWSFIICTHEVATATQYFQNPIRVISPVFERLSGCPPPCHFPNCGISVLFQF